MIKFSFLIFFAVLLVTVFMSPNLAEAQTPPVLSGEMKRVPHNTFVSTTYNFSIYDNIPTSDMNIINTMSLGEIADFFIEPYDTGISYKERDVWIREDNNAYVIYLEYTQFSTNARKNGL